MGELEYCLISSSALRTITVYNVLVVACVQQHAAVEAASPPRPVDGEDRRVVEERPQRRSSSTLRDRGAGTPVGPVPAAFSGTPSLTTASHATGAGSRGSGSSSGGGHGTRSLSSPHRSPRRSSSARDGATTTPGQGLSP
jgi:hypothetical protein